LSGEDVPFDTRFKLVVTLLPKTASQT